MNLTLTGKRHLTGNIWAFEFRPQTPLDWQPGQFIRINLPHTDPDAEGTRRFFTVAAAPHEGLIRIATRLTGTSFKQALDHLMIGEPIQLLDPPAGDFVWHESDKPLVLVAQGIGITPFYSMLLAREHQGLPLNAHLIYANHSDEIAFADQLAQWREAHPELQVSFVSAPADAAGLAAVEPRLERSLIYISGPKAMISLLAPPYNVPVANLKQDRFSGYAAINY